MLCEVILCRKDGRRLRRSEWPAPVLGTLVIRESAADKNNFKRHVRVAQLKVARHAFSTSSVDAVAPLFDPQFLPAPDGKLLIRGIELCASSAEVFEHEQM